LKLIHFADLHLGVESYGKIEPTSGLSSRFHDFLAVLDELVDYAIESKVDLVVFGGDAYKTRDPTPTQQREFAKRINRLSLHNIPIFLLIGNHDLPNAIGRATTTEIFDTLAVKNVYVANKPEVFRIPTPGGEIQVAALPWLRRSALLSREETKDLNFEQINQRLQQILTGVIEAQVAKLDPSLPAILAAHVWVSGAKVGSEKTMTIGQEHVLLLSNIARPEFDYIALGHIHKHQVLSPNPPAVYAGSLERLDFSDENDDKGFYVVEIRGKGQVAYEFQQVNARRFLTIELKLEPGDSDPTATVLSAIAEQGEKVKEAIVRVNLILPEGMESQLRDNDIRDALKGAHYFTVAREVQREARVRMGVTGAEELTPIDALKKWLELKNTSPEKMKVLMEYGEQITKED